jgi:hypothetical protein
MSAIENLRNRIDLVRIPFTDRGSRLLLFQRGDTLSIRLAERWEKWQGQVGHYRLRPPMIDNWCFCDGDETALPLSAETFPHLAGIITEVGRFNITFVDAETLLIRLPAGRFGLQFITYTEQGAADRRGGILRGKRNIAYTTNARLIQNSVVSLSPEPVMQVKLMLEAKAGDVLLLNITPRMAFNRSLMNPEVAIEAARRRWSAWFNAAPPVLEEYRTHYEYAWWVMRAGLLNTRYFFTREACVPSKIHYVGVWHWDQFFHALAYRHLDPRLAEDQIRIVFDHQREDGMLPDAIHDEGLVTHLSLPVDADVTKPPLAAWTVLKLHEKSGRLDFLEEIYEPLLRWHNWWVTHNANGNGLCEYHHPFSSGLDDSPLWDDGMPVVAPDLNTYLCLQCESLAKIADLIGLPDDAAKFREDADQIADAMLKTLWNQEHGCFEALHDGQIVNVFTPFHLLPIWTGRMPEAVVKCVLEHLTNPDEFDAPYPLPTVALNDPKFDPLQMWRGPTWVNINYLFIEALQRIGQMELARILRRKTLDLLMQHPDIYEYYNPLNADHPPKAAPIFGWSSAVFIDLAIQETQERTQGEAVTSVHVAGS